MDGGEAIEGITLVGICEQFFNSRQTHLELMMDAVGCKAKQQHRFYNWLVGHRQMNQVRFSERLHHELRRLFGAHTVHGEGRRNGSC